MTLKINVINTQIPVSEETVTYLEYVESKSKPDARTIGTLELDHYDDVVSDLEELLDTYNTEHDTSLNTSNVTLEVKEVIQDTTKDVDNVADLELINHFVDEIPKLEGNKAAKLIERLLDRIEYLESHTMTAILICLEDGYEYDPFEDKVQGVDYLDDIVVYYVDSYKELAEQFIDEGLYGEIPEPIKYHIDYGSIGHELTYDYSEATIAGENVIYRMF